VTDQFTIDPQANVPWFAASDASIPRPGPAGTAQTFEITGLDSTKQWHFAVKAYTRRNP
jgi:hypothetical protein